MVVNVEQLQAQVDFLQAQVKQMADMLALYSVNGLNDAFDGTGNQTYGGGIMRLDKNGIQIKANGSQIVGLSFVDEFQPTALGSYKPLSGISGYARTTGLSGLNFISKGNLASSSASQDFIVNESSVGAELSRIILSALPGGLSSNEAQILIQSTTGAEKRVEIVSGSANVTVLSVGNGTSDPSFTLADADIWYRRDTNKLRLRANGATENLATESYVTANAGVAVKTEQMITPWSWCSLGMQLAAMAASAPTSGAWPAANEAIYVPFTLDESTTFTKAFWLNGATSSGNVDIGIYNEAGTKQVSMGSTAQGTINVVQTVDIADTTLAAGRYYAALVMDNTTGTMFRTTGPGIGAEFFKSTGVAGQATAFALPATATFATPTRNFLPYFGFSIRTLVT